jgi:VWA domain-containing protein
VTSIPLADAAALRRSARITLLARGALAAAVVGLAVGFLFVSRHPGSQTIVRLPAGGDTVLVLDLSASISNDTFSRIGGTLAALSRSGRRVGLVAFSDQAYEALPPSTPAADLAPLVRYFTLPPQRHPGFLPSFPSNPWQKTFTGGTRISAGMELAHELAVSTRRRATVVLVSDLDDNPGDVPRLARVLLAFRRDQVPVRIEGLDPTPSDAAFFRKLLGPSAPITEAPKLEQVPSHVHSPFPWTLVALTVIAASTVALGALWAPRLEVGA